MQSLWFYGPSYHSSWVEEAKRTRTFLNIHRNVLTFRDYINPDFLIDPWKPTSMLEIQGYLMKEVEPTG